VYLFAVLPRFPGTLDTLARLIQEVLDQPFQQFLLLLTRITAPAVRSGSFSLLSLHETLPPCFSPCVASSTQLCLAEVSVLPKALVSALHACDLRLRAQSGFFISYLIQLTFIGNALSWLPCVLSCCFTRLLHLVCACSRGDAAGCAVYRLRIWPLLHRRAMLLTSVTKVRFFSLVHAKRALDRAVSRWFSFRRTITKRRTALQWSRSISTSTSRDEMMLQAAHRLIVSTSIVSQPDAAARPDHHDVLLVRAHSLCRHGGLPCACLFSVTIPITTVFGVSHTPSCLLDRLSRSCLLACVCRQLLYFAIKYSTDRYMLAYVHCKSPQVG
jgi:hypothetical protein